jgi:hypothetical protein
MRTGMLGGLFIRFVLRDQQLFDLVHFDERTFFLFILPPIIFGAGLSLNSVSRMNARFPTLGSHSLGRRVSWPIC